MLIGEAIQLYRTKRGMSRAELADKAQLGRVTIYDIEKGNETPRFVTLQLICDALEVSPSDLLVCVDWRPQ